MNFCITPRRAGKTLVIIQALSEYYEKFPEAKSALLMAGEDRVWLFRLLANGRIQFSNQGEQIGDYYRDKRAKPNLVTVPKEMSLGKSGYRMCEGDYSEIEKKMDIHINKEEQHNEKS